MSAYERLAPQFLTAQHRQSFYQALSKFLPIEQRSSEYQSALFIMTSTDELIEKMLPYFTKTGFQAQEMFAEEDFSSRYRKMAMLAVNLYNGDYEEPILDIITDLDPSMFQTMLQALIIRKYGVKSL
ncbi:DUF6075 family protein [Planococcus lenghuensis]|uniref:Uncharacterized protein n=1 Tax=Planococcus lenghuensis TaxID=2213202 RepID=A0A1Q2L605_9BACL|nr:DUF6075 family protein [Planococcus lenghuensis]AQQ55527.1 hypothetical protein B0X71_20340 [Planococcus lenghuensis]